MLKQGRLEQVLAHHDVILQLQASAVKVVRQTLPQLRTVLVQLRLLQVKVLLSHLQIAVEEVFDFFAIQSVHYHIVLQ